VIHACYRNSHTQTAAVAMMLWLHRAIGTWKESVDGYIVMTEFMKSRMVHAGLPEQRVHVRPHLLTVSQVDPAGPGGNYVVFLGRLTHQKGVDTLLEAASRFHAPVRIVGSGPMGESVRTAASAQPGLVQLMDQLPHGRAMSLLAGARALLLPSRSYEAFPLVIAEAMLNGVPVVTTDLGGRSEVVADSVNGFLIRPGDANALVDRTNRLIDDPELRARMSAAARETYRMKLAPDISYRRLIEIYDSARASAATRAMAS